MQVIEESSILADVGLLDGAWRRPESFVVVPRKSGITAGWIEKAIEQIPRAFHADHFGLLTSGSTGLPKLIVGSRARAEALAKLLHVVQDSEETAQAVVLLPLSYSYAFVNQWLWSRVSGRELVVTSGFSDPGSLHRAFTDARSALVCMVAGHVQLVMDHFPGERFPGVARLHFAGGPFPQHRLEQLRQVFPSARVYNNFGCAEAMPRLTVRLAEHGHSAADIGRPLPGVELRTTDASGALLFRSPYSAVGFVEHERFHAIAPEDWVPTGDAGREVHDGRFEVLGRAGEVFKRYGEKVSLELLRATVLSAWSGDAVFYRDRDRAGEHAHVLVLAPHPTEAALRKVLAALRAKHRRPQWPLRVESVGALPLLPNAKPDLVAVKAVERQLQWDQRT